MKNLFVSVVTVIGVLIFNQSVLAKPAVDVAPKFVSGSSTLVQGSNNIRAFKYTQNGNNKKIPGLAFCGQVEPLYSTYHNGEWYTIIPNTPSGVALFKAVCK